MSDKYRYILNKVVLYGKIVYLLVGNKNKEIKSNFRRIYRIVRNE